MSNTLREITKAQFSQGTQIVGTKLDQLMAALLGAFNNPQARHRGRRWVERTIAGGYMPAPQAQGRLQVQDQIPFLNSWNAPQLKEATPRSIVAPPPNTIGNNIRNTYRNKGWSIDGLLVEDWGSDEEFVVWSMALGFHAPSIITGMSVTLMADQVYTNNWQYGANPPPGHNAADYLDDLYLEINIDAPTMPEDALLREILAHKFKFPVSTQFYGNMFPPPGLVETEPNHPAGPFGGTEQEPTRVVYVDLQNLSIPIPRDSRVRFSIGLPWYNRVGPKHITSGWQHAGDTQKPWNSQYYAWSLHCLDPIVIASHQDGE